ncbi:PepSY domain-containing protein [Neobacillus sp. YIM B06451]|uniref:PepSY domain-containing protein n=1 Tax=Neobacillus sp. YIM B06451 TaxID=3070994 RepID=UPI002930110A|nr:PepSY domain-containing protein [Neobacillus sp. YIM B06451]
MNWKAFLFGAVAGAAGAYAVNAAISHKMDVPAQKVLNHARSQFRLSGQVSGSWIHMEAVPFEKNGIQYKVYRGGITRTSPDLEDGTEQFEFVADATTGTILDVYRL